MFKSFNPITKKIIAFAVIIYALYFFWFGSVLPVIKACLFRPAAESLKNGTAFNDFADRFYRLLNFFSPVGQAESAGELGSSVLNILLNSRDLQKENAAILIKFSESYLNPVIDAKNGHLAKNIFIMANTYYVAGSRFDEKDWLDKAERFYLKGLEVSPGRPEFLYALFDLYNAAGDKEKANDIGKEILAIWPNDDQIKAIMTGESDLYGEKQSEPERR